MKAPLLFCLLFTLPMTGVRADQSADFTKGNTRDLAGAGAAGKDVGAVRTASGTETSDPQGNKQEPASLLPEGWDPALAGDRVLERLIKVTAPQVKGAHDAEFVCVGDRAYVVSEVNDVRGGESGEWPFIYSTMSIVNLATLKTERVVDFARGEQVFSNATLPAGACWVPRILQKDADTLRCYFVSQAPGHRQSQMWYRDFDLKRGEFNPAIFRAKLKTATGVHDFQPQHFYADAAAQGFTKKASDSFFFLFDSFKRFDGRLYVALNNFTGRQNALALVHDDLETFEVLGHYNEPQTQALSESAVNRLPDGTWMAICRNDKGNYHFATSRDGRQWGVAREMPFVKNGLNSKPTFDTFGDVYYLGWQENTRIQGANRSVFNVDISRDGVHWERKYRFETPRSFQYPTFHEHEGSVWLCVTQGDTDDSRKERIMFGKLEAVGGFESQKDQRRSVVNPVPTGGPSVIVDPGAAFQNDVRSGAMVIGMDRTPKGRLWGCWTGTGDKRDGYFLLATSDDGGTSWSRPRLAVGAKTDASQQMHGALVGNLWTDPKGRLWLFFDQQLGDPEKRITNWYLRCDNPDAAEPTWSAPVQFAEGCTLNKPVVLKNGEWLLPVSDWKQKTARVFVSGDEGVSWKERGNLQFPDWEFDEHMMVERKDGRLWMLARTKGQPHESFSSDGGRTWTAPQKAGTLQNINARFFLRRLQSGRLLLVKNGPINQRLPRRSSLSAYLSDDDGKTWSQGLLLDDRAEVSYPDGFEAPDGLIHILYDWNRHTDAEILMAKFREEDVLAGKIVSQDTKMRMLVNKALAPHLPSSITPDPKWTAQGMEDAKQDFKSIPYDGVTPNKMVCDTTLRELPDGSWILFMLAGGDTEPSPLNYTGVTRSGDQGKTWTPLERFDVGFPREGKTIGQGPTELMILGQRSTLFFSTHSKHWANDWRSWFLTSDDSFRTWTKPQEVPGRLKERTFIRKHIVTRDGRIVIPFQHYVGPESEQDKAPLDRAFTNPRNGVLISSDGGATWTEHGNIRLTPNDRYFGWAENDLFEHPDGRITMIIRADGLGGLLFKAESKDGGKTWPEFASITAIPNPGSKATLYNLGGDCVAILHNPNSKQRSPMALWISFDGMKSWPYQRVLQAESCDGPKRAMNYPDGFVSKDRQWLHFAFDDNRHRAVHYSAKLPPLP